MQPTTTQQQKKAHKILIKKNHFCGGVIPFDKTTNYVAILIETNAHRKQHGAIVLK